MSVELEDKRPSVLDARLYELLSELKRFRHLVRHRYGFDLDPKRVAENHELLKEAFPSFVDAVRELERYMTEERGDDEDEDQTPSVNTPK